MVIKLSVQELLDKVEWPIEQWLNKKGYAWKSHGIGTASRRIGISEDYLRAYLQLIIKKPFRTWQNELRANDAKMLIDIRSTVLGDDITGPLEVKSYLSFYDSYKYVVGVYPSIWIRDNMKKLGSSPERFRDDLTTSLIKVKQSFDCWEKEFGYRKRGTDIRSVSKQLLVSSKELSIYCQLVLMEPLGHWIEQHRISDAKQILCNDPSLSIPSISKMLGYYTENSFRESFRSFTCMSPEAWRGEPEPVKDPIPSSKTQILNLVLSFDIEPVTQWINEKGFCTSNITQSNVARMLGFSEARFSQYLRTVAKTSFADWIASMRIEEAKRLLSSSPSLSVLEIAEKVGVPNKGTFYALFRQNTGMTPDDWREKNNQGR